MIGLKESFRLMYSNTHLKSCETLPLNRERAHLKCWTVLEKLFNKPKNFSKLVRKCINMRPAHALPTLLDGLLLLAEELDPTLLHLSALLSAHARLHARRRRLLLQAARLGRHAH